METAALRPALTAREWKSIQRDNRSVFVCGNVDDGMAELEGEERHQVAAKCLYGQTFGFTEDDLRLIRHVPFASYKGAGRVEEYQRLQTIGDRIAALIPYDSASTEVSGK